ncbi:MAG: hypothetical protein ABSF09_11580 [Candidatus Bathyarchaeia archaeon]|jgi:hypothetical protein
MKTVTLRVTGMADASISGFQSGNAQDIRDTFEAKAEEHAGKLADMQIINGIITADFEPPETGDLIKDELLKRGIKVEAVDKLDALITRLEGRKKTKES